MTREELIETTRRISLHIHRTPILRSRSLDEAADVRLYFKCESFQRTGSFKIRGAANAILSLHDDDRKKGVATHSSGNFAQALAQVAQDVGIKAHVVMPCDAPEAKKKAVARYGAKITLCSPPTLREREKAVKEVIRRTGATFIHASNDRRVIEGQGTATFEFLEEQYDLDAIFFPVGGGGLIAGGILATRFLRRPCQIFGGEPFAADDAYRSFRRGTIESNKTTCTIADGLRTQLGEVTFPLIREHAKDIVRVEEREIVTAMKLIGERLKVVVEPSGAVAFAAFLREKERFKGQKVGILLSGGNLTLDTLFEGLVNDAQNPRR